MFLECLEANALPKMIRSSGVNVGRLPQIMATAGSTVVRMKPRTRDSVLSGQHNNQGSNAMSQEVLLISSWVSMFLTSSRTRIQATTMVLSTPSVHEKYGSSGTMGSGAEVTHATPSRNTPEMANFCALGRWSFQTSWVGRKRIIMSWMMFGTELPKNHLVLSKQ